MLRNILNTCLSPTSLSVFLDVSLQTRWLDSKVVQRHDSYSSPFLPPHQEQGCHRTECTCNSQSQSPAGPGSSQVPCTRPPVISISTKCSHLPQLSLPCHFLKSSVKGKWKKNIQMHCWLTLQPSTHSTALLEVYAVRAPSHCWIQGWQDRGPAPWSFHSRRDRCNQHVNMSSLGRWACLGDEKLAARRDWEWHLGMETWWPGGMRTEICSPKPDQAMGSRSQ